ncbi:MAG: hypothetical protein IJD04_08190, partial [Desulfovibrionaceae bacterium]|nr:hypothetical protein [Desulfovibrionaceae bacterium]
NGNFLVEILRRKLGSARKKYGRPLLRADFERASVQAVMSIYGVELLADNTEACRERLFDIWNDAYCKVCGADANEQCRNVVKYILSKNILCGDALNMKQADGSPIIFAEWSFIGGSLVKRRNFEFATLLKVSEQARSGQIPLEVQGVDYDEAKREFIPKSVEEYPPTDYRRLCEHG